MGLSDLPAGSRVLLDTQFVIYLVEGSVTCFQRCDAIWKEMARLKLVPVLSELCVHECLVHPMRRGESELLKSFDLFFARPDVHLRPISQNILRLGAEFRAHYAKLRAPDAIHLATAVDAEAALIVTNDKAWTGTVATEILLIDSYI